MRIGVTSDDAFMQSLGSSAKSMRPVFAKIMAQCTASLKTSVMMGDSVVKDAMTFDPTKVHDSLVSITSSLDGWEIQDTTTTSNEDKRRLFTKFNVTESDITLSGHLSLQYHVLLYYTPNQRVLDCQKELAKLIDDTGGHDDKRASLADEITKSKLESSGITNPTEQEMFEALYNNDLLRETITKEINERTDPQELSLAEKKSKLYVELDTHLLEVYQTSQVLIDEARLVGGEEGYVFTLDIDVKNGTFDPSLVEKSTREAISTRMSQLKDALERQDNSA